ncbi:hypothetical protein sscle_09g070830 [Sclerotinia sclerotiorum 1980 UF-70]|uniref:Uncharacterized protein n=1 Tax=Sclerotinia sclerotiorum (strain ATCC 18683 / 1980 / Ss-1) TaxID=665079 RepID=A0A1D9QCH2_SCLS1|nr:hypothetical protein sscle_09g070830 [Sclerotinia sclerotiorum 1980 UF-70]
MATAPEVSLSQFTRPHENNPEDQNPDSEAIQDDSGRNRSYSPGILRVLFAILIIECILAPVNILSGMMASEGKIWSLVFVCIHSLEMLNITKSTLWHLGCCILIFYFFCSVLKISSSLLPQWIPTIVDCGLGFSIGMQSLPRDYLHGLRDWAIEVVGSLCSGVPLSSRYATSISP